MDIKEAIDKIKKGSEPKGVLEHLVKEQQGEHYKNNIDIDLEVQGLDKANEYVDDIEMQTLTYDIEIEYRGWGINGISVYPRGTMEFKVPILEYTDEEDRVKEEIPVKIDFDNVDYDIDWLPGKVYIPVSMDVTIDRKGKVIGKVVLVFYFVDQNE